MKKTLLWLLVASCMAQAAEITHKLDLSIKRIDDDHIARYLTKVTKELEYNALHRKIILGGTLLGLSYLTYQLLRGGQQSGTPHVVPGAVSDKPVEEFNIVEEPREITQKPKDLQLTQEGIWYLNAKGASKKAKDNLSLLPWVFAWTKENFYTLLQQTAVLALFTGLNNSLGPISKYINAFDGVVDKVLDHVFHDGNLTWFLKRHTQLSILFTMVEHHAAILENKPNILQQSPIATIVPLTPEKNEYHLQQLVSAWNILVYQFEYIFGYMHYSIALPKRYQLAVLQAQALMETMKQEFAHCADGITAWSTTIINNHEPYVATSLSDYIKTLHSNVEHDLNAFAELERLKPY